MVFLTNVFTLKIQPTIPRFLSFSCRHLLPPPFRKTSRIISHSLSLWAWIFLVTSPCVYSFLLSVSRFPFLCSPFFPFFLLQSLAHTFLFQDKGGQIASILPTWPVHSSPVTGFLVVAPQCRLGLCSWLIVCFSLDCCVGCSRWPPRAGLLPLSSVRSLCDPSPDAGGNLGPLRSSCWRVCFSSHS